MHSFALFSVLALAATSVSADFATDFKNNLTTAATGQLNQAKTAQGLIDGNTTDTNSNNFKGAGSSDISQDSLTLDPSQVVIGAFVDGQAQPGADAGQVKSLTSKNNFINFCATQQMILSNGVQNRGIAMCNPVVIGALPSSDQIPTTTFSNPINGANLKAETPINLQVRTTNMAFGNFVNAQSNYGLAPQQLDSSGKILGHSHIVCNAMSSLTDTTNVDAANFVFFQGLNQNTFNGVLTGSVKQGFPAGAYRCCTMTSSSNHNPVVLGIAQRNSPDDCVRFTVSEDGDATANQGDADAAKQAADNAAQLKAQFTASQAQLAGNGGGADAGASSAAADTSATANEAAVASASAVTQTGGRGKGKGKNGGGAGQGGQRGTGQTGQRAAGGQGKGRQGRTNKVVNADVTVPSSNCNMKRHARREERRTRHHAAI